MINNQLVQRVTKLDPLTVESEIQKKLYLFPGRNLAYAFNAGENIILYGPGGYGS